MPALPLRLATVAILVFLAVTGFDLATGLEHWPFSNYPMYSLPYAGQLSWLRLYGVSDAGEIPLRGERDFAPFDEARLIVALQRLQVTGQSNLKLDEALRDLMRLYNRRLSLGPAARPSLRALRLYIVFWTLRPGLQGSEPPLKRVLVAQVSDGEAGR